VVCSISFGIFVPVYFDSSMDHIQKKNINQLYMGHIEAFLLVCFFQFTDLCPPSRVQICVNKFPIPRVLVLYLLGSQFNSKHFWWCINMYPI